MNKVILSSIVLLGVILGGITIATSKNGHSFGSVTTGSDYQATSTRNYDGTSLSNFTVVKKGFGALKGVTITGANTGIVRLWDATTTDAISGRAASLASSSILIATIPASAAANDYGYDVTFNYGLLYELVGGLAPTSTIIYR